MTAHRQSCTAPHRGRCQKETPGLDYPQHFERRQVRQDGSIRWHGEFVFVSEVLVGEPVGLEEVDEGTWSLYFGSLLLARLRTGERKINTGAPSNFEPSPRW